MRSLSELDFDFDLLTFLLVIGSVYEVVSERGSFSSNSSATIRLGPRLTWKLIDSKCRAIIILFQLFKVNRNHQLLLLLGFGGRIGLVRATVLMAGLVGALGDYFLCRSVHASGLLSRVAINRPLIVSGQPI